MKKILLILMLGIFLTSLVSADINSPTNYWDFNEVVGSTTAADSAGSKPLTVDSAKAGFIVGVIGNAINISSTGNPINTTNGANFAYGTGNFTIAFWINSTATTGSIAIMENDGSNANGWGINKPQDDGRLQFVANSAEQFNITVNVYNSSWNHVVIVREGTGANDVKIYVNNDNVANKTLNIDLSYTGGTFTLDRQALGQAVYLDEVKLYKGYAWNVSDVQQDYGIALGRIYATTTLLTPNTNQATANATVTFTSSSLAQGINAQLTNATLYLWLKNHTLFTTSTDTLTGTSDSSTFNIGSLDLAMYDWNVYSCATNSTGTACDWGASNRTLIWGIGEPVFAYSATDYETSSSLFNVSFNVSSGSPSGNLYWDGTKYPATASILPNGKWKLEKNLSIPTGTGAKNFFWEIITSTFNFNTTTNTQTVSLINLTLCQVGNTVSYLNFTFVNETSALEDITATISATWNYWLGDGSVSKSLTYTSGTEKSSYAFCFSPSSYTLKRNLSVNYDNAESQQRSYNPGSGTYSNVTTNTSLYLLPTSAGIYVTFQVINSADQVVPGAIVTITRTGIGTVASTTTDSAGTATFFLDPLVAYTITVEATGYDTYSTTITPSQTSYTITLGGVATSTIDDYTRGITYHINPKAGVLNNGTYYNFNISLTSSIWTVSEFGFYLTNGSVVIGSTSLASNGGAVNLNLSTGQNKTIIMNYYWLINGNYTNGTILYTVRDWSDNGFSIANFINNVKTYLTAGIFGINTTSLSIILFLIIFISGGIMSYKFGLTSPAAIMLFIFVLVAFFDAGLNLIPRPVSNPAVASIPLLTIIVGLIFIGVLIREVSR